MRTLVQALRKKQKIYWIKYLNLLFLKGLSGLI